MDVDPHQARAKAIADAKIDGMIGTKVDLAPPTEDDFGARIDDGGGATIGDGTGGRGGGLTGIGDGNDLSAKPQPLDTTSASTLPYTKEAMRDHVEGDVTLVLQIDAAGYVTSTAVQRGIGHGLDEIAATVARKFTFKPALDRYGNKTAGSVKWRFHFTRPTAEPLAREDERQLVVVREPTELRQRQPVRPIVLEHAVAGLVAVVGRGVVLR